MRDNSLLFYKINQRELKLPINEQILVEDKLNNTKKNTVAEWLLWIFLGRLGFHRFYIDKSYGLGIFLLDIIGLMLTCTIIFAIIGIPMVCAAWIWWLIDGFYISNWLKYDSNIKRNEIINNITNTNVSVASLTFLNNNKLIKDTKGKHFKNN